MCDETNEVYNVYTFDLGSLRKSIIKSHKIRRKINKKGTYQMVASSHDKGNGVQ
jgi:hypothetical protein